MTNTTPSPGPSRRPGRPRSGQDPEVRRRLVEAASSLFADRGYRGTSVRQIAQAAEVTPAMVGYYFGDKLGLLEAVLDSVFEHLLEGIQDLANHSPEDGSPIERSSSEVIHVLFIGYHVTECNTMYQDGSSGLFVFLLVKP